MKRARHRKLVVFDPDKYIVDIPEIRLPLSIKLMFGCRSCEWRNTWQCQYGFKRGKGIKESENTHMNGFCDERVKYLKYFLPDGKHGQVKKTEFMDSMNRVLGQMQLMEDYQKMKQLEEEAAAIKRRKPKLEAEALLAMYRQRWQSLWEAVQHQHQKKLDRDQPKKIDMTVTKMSISDIDRVMRGEKVVDAEIVEDEEEK